MATTVVLANGLTIGYEPAPDCNCLCGTAALCGCGRGYHCKNCNCGYGKPIFPHGNTPYKGDASGG